MTEKCYVYLLDTYNKTHKVFDIVPVGSVINGRHYGEKIQSTLVYKVSEFKDTHYDEWGTP